MHFSHTIAIVIPRPLVLSVIDGRMRQLQPLVTAILVRIDHRGITRDGLAENALAGTFVTVTDHPAPLLPTVSADDMNDRRPVIVVRTVTPVFVRAAARGIVHVAMRRTFFPGVLSELIHLERLAIHRIGWRIVVHIGLDSLSQSMDGLSRQMEFARQSRRRFALGDTTEQEHQSGWPLAKAFKGRAAE